MVTARRATLAREPIEAAHDLGAGPIQAFPSVVLPWLAPAMLGSGLFRALASFDDLIRSLFLGGYEPTLPVLIFGRLRSGLTPELSAVSTLILLIACGAVAGADLVASRRATRRTGVPTGETEQRLRRRDLPGVVDPPTAAWLAHDPATLETASGRDC